MKNILDKGTYIAPYTNIVKSRTVLTCNQYIQIELAIFVTGIMFGLMAIFI
jgi:hypothetical protein